MNFMYKLIFVLSLAVLQALPVQVAAQDVNNQEVADLLRDGKNAIDQKKFDEAIVKCRAGLDKLGSAYARAEVIDDTGLKMVVADIQRREGKVENASQMYCRILAERFEQLIKR
jgi:hypothetical protein